MNAEYERILANMIRVGVVAELDAENARVKMNVGGLVTDWIPFQAARAGATRTWSAPRPGEQMMVFAPYGDTGQAVAAVPLYQDDHPAPATSQDQETTVYPDGSTVEYDSATNTLTVTVADGGNVIVNCKHVTVNTEDATIVATDHVTVDSPQSTFTGAVTVEGLLTYQAGLAGSGGGANTATLTGNMNISGNIVSGGVITDSNGDGGA